MTDRKQALLAQTRFYKGEADYDEAPHVTDGQSAGYWDYEHVWVRWELEQAEEYLRLVDWFKREVLKDQALYPSVPVGLQAIFASRINYWGGREPVTLEDVYQFCHKYEQKYSEVQKQREH
ncbi:MAG: hypothetical protein J5612_04525 [Paludibacteraceae bacterium]|nr:hypothetical protein [Paludibacteraceae bacterium]